MFLNLGGLLRKGWHFLLPGSCMWCSLPLSQPDSQLCADCQQALPLLPYRLCHYNLLLLPAIARGISAAKFDRLVALSVYQQPYRHWIPQWKYHTDLAAGQLLQQQLIRLVLDCQAKGMPMPQALTYVPMHWRKQQQRGFNQAKLLAESLAAQLKLPLLSLFKKHASHSQRGLNRRQRLRNLRRAFQLKSQLPSLPQHIALVDDVITTGATANTLSKLLRRAGVRTISVWTLAVTTTADYSV